MVLKQNADEIARLRRDIDNLTTDIKKLESELASTGSIRTMDEVQMELQQLQDQWFVNISYCLHVLSDDGLSPVKASAVRLRAKTGRYRTKLLKFKREKTLFAIPKRSLAKRGFSYRTSRELKERLKSLKRPLNK